jgi:hypothetical protein
VKVMLRSGTTYDDEQDRVFKSDRSSERNRRRNFRHHDPRDIAIQKRISVLHACGKSREA